jgi:hypothetical protein
MPTSKPKSRSRAKLPPITFPAHKHPGILRRAKELNQTPTDYIQSLVDMDLAGLFPFGQLDRGVPKPFSEILPKKSLGRISDAEIVALVKECRVSARRDAERPKSARKSA